MYNPILVATKVFLIIVLCRSLPFYWIRGKQMWSAWTQSNGGSFWTVQKAVWLSMLSTQKNEAVSLQRSGKRSYRESGCSWTEDGLGCAIICWMLGSQSWKKTSLHLYICFEKSLRLPVLYLLFLVRLHPAIWKTKWYKKNITAL